MINESDISNLFDIKGVPPSIQTISDLRKKYARPSPMTEGSVSFGIAMYSPPLMGLELIPALGAAAVEACLPDPIGDLLADRPLASQRKWTGMSQKYVEAVHAMGRPLVGAEVNLLEAQNGLENVVTGAISILKRAIFD